MIAKKIAFIGFGNVGTALANLFMNKEHDLKNEFNIQFLICGILTKRHGQAINLDGIDLKQALTLLKSNQSISSLNKIGSMTTTDVKSFIQNCQADVLFESTPVNYDSGQPAIDYLKWAIENGMDAITANKGPVVHGYQQLTKLANLYGKQFLFESSVMDGAPIFSLFRSAIPGLHLFGFRGILNSTTNLIINLMEEGREFAEAVSYAQKIGIAETDPSGDIDGWDAAVKVCALVNVLMKKPVLPENVERKGIREITLDHIAYAKSEGKRWKLICSAKVVNDQLFTCVAPELVDPSSSLFAINGTSSCIEFETDLLGKFSIIEEDPSPDTTAYGMYADFLHVINE